MKSIKDYIIEDNVLEQVLLNHLLYHIDVQVNIVNPLSYLNESLGTFNSCGKIAEHIFNELYENEFQDELNIDVTKYKSYMDKVHIKCTKSSELYASYIGQHNRIINVELSVPEKITYTYYDDLMFLLIHELMHGYEDKRRIIYGKPSIFNLLDDKYIKSIRIFKSINKLTRNIGRFNYLFNKQEQNAYFGTLDNIIKTIVEKTNSTQNNIEYNDIIKEIKNSHTFKIYFELGEFIVNINNDDLTDSDKKQILDLYKNYYKEDITYNKLVKKLNNKWNCFYSKFNQLTPKIICKYIIKPTKKTYDIIK